MAALPAKLLKLGLIVSVLGGLYLVALKKHAERDEIRQAAVDLTPGCKAKLESYALQPGEDYRSPYVLKMTGSSKQARGYSEADVRAIQRGCNIVDDTQGQLAKDAARERWNSGRFMRGKHASCHHCHQDVGDKQDAAGNRLVGSNGLAASWVMADMYDRFTGLLLPVRAAPDAVLHQFVERLQAERCRRSAAGCHRLQPFPDRGRGSEDRQSLCRAGHGRDSGLRNASKRGDDYVRGAHLYKQKCARCHGPQGFGTVVDGKVVYPRSGRAPIPSPWIRA